MSYAFLNNGHGRAVTDFPGDTRHDRAYHLAFEIDAPNANRKIARHNGLQEIYTTKTYDPIGENYWNNNWIGFYSQADEGNATNAIIGPITLTLKEYNLKTVDPIKRSFDTYTLQGDKKTVTQSVQYSPGSLTIGSIASNVGNDKTVNGTAAGVFRSDLVTFKVNYSSENPNGQYAYYDGFEVMNDNTVVATYKGSHQLLLDVNFFQKSGVLDAIRSGTITIRPIFVKREATVVFKKISPSDIMLTLARRKATRRLPAFISGIK